jgi:hypothetical protein
MARGRKGGPSRMDLRRQGEAAEAREGEEVEKDDDEEKDEDDEDDEDEEAEGEEAEGDGEDGEAEPADDEDDEDAPKKKPKKKAVKAPAVKKAAVKRTRAVKEVRMRASWVVFDNGNKRIETFPYSQKAEAEKYLADKIEEKNATFFLQLVKEEMS